MTTRTNGKATSERQIAANALRQIATLRSELIDRYQFASHYGLGTTHLGARDLYAAGGYPRKLTNAHYLDLYQRGDIAERLVEAYPKATWTPGASIFEDEDPDNITLWEIAVNTLFDKLDIWGVFKRADILSRIGEHGYSVILIGDKSRTPLDQPISPSITFDSLIYLQPLHEKNATILELDEDVDSERYSYPLVYQVRLGSDKGRKSSTRKVHWSRLIHFTEGGLDNPVYGPPALRSIFNRLYDMEKIYTGGSEAAWKRMDPGVAYSAKESATLGFTDEEVEQAVKEFREQLEDFRNGATRDLLLDNMDVTQLTAPVHNFGSNIDSIIKVVAGAKGYPQRKLTGSEEAQLASTQDRSNWQDEVDNRQLLIALPHVRTFVDRVNSDNPPEWDIFWPTRDELNDHEKAELVATLAKANSDHYQASGELLYTGSEIRDKIGDAPMEEEQLAEIDQGQEDIEGGDNEIDNKGQSLTVNRSSRSRRSMKSGRIASLLAAKRKHVDNKNQSRGVVLVDPSARSLGKHSQSQSQHLQSLSQRSLAPADDRDEQTAVRRIADTTRSSFASMMIDLWSSTLTDDDIEVLRVELDNQDRAIEFVNVKIDSMESRARTLLRERYTSIVEKAGKASLRVVERRGSFSARRKVGALKAGDTHSRALKLMDFSITNPRAIEWARNRSATLITEIGPSTRDVVREIVTSGLRDGRAPRVIAKEIGSYVGLRSDQLDTLRKFEAGGATESQVARRAKQLLKQRGEVIARTECLPSETLVDAAVVRAVHRRFYEGHMIEVATADGRKFRATPNHPMLTNRGWVNANELNESDYLVYDAREQNPGPLHDPNITAPPTPIGEVFDAANAVGITQRVSTRQPDFHGDGMDGEVDIAWPFWLLRLGHFATIDKPLENFLFSSADESRLRVCDLCKRLLAINQRECFCRSTFGRSAFSQTSIDQMRRDIEVGTDAVLALSRLVTASDLAYVDIGAVVSGLSSSPVERAASLTQAASRHSLAAQEIANTTGIQVDDPSYFSGTQPALIKLDRVLSVAVREFSGHVFNLSTPYGYFNIQGGLYTGNTMRSSNAGLREMWNQAVDNELLPPDVKREWIATGDDRTRDEHEDLDGEQVGLNESFSLGYEPGEEVACRCSQGII